ncbi:MULTISPECIES: CesT family type III secretion system chaperone [Pseudomonas syringae group]|uniref:Type III chaperone protein ShcF n=2 Tax=Pseudomonas syringae group TaxID=136849 RepID=A0A2K4X2H0_PSESX|nr:MULTISPECIES: CesT family type III secretion system chaperone [Pseudomonas syringae group]AVB12511.1 type III chaperone protein ShcF [Pseudomonas amygdali pv. morsprunorum]KWS61417.1 type III chaperone protein ShcF [Pseudomonas amygdali pv. morsprunorum]MDT3227806.1 CesT family type III secretion system chaperone [Pseudomonas amygdali pv. morsprunorum]MDT3244564.1 CesT family type III secretion system chaperone [Pseudomonas amygdali pv. morsprunorum]MDT3269116.1 CesT family type III secreti
MKNSFDRLIDGLAKEYGMPSFPEKKHDYEIYCFEFEIGISIKIYQDKFRWVYFVAEIGQIVEANNDTLMSMLNLNSFSFRKPFFTLGLNGNKVGELHARIPLLEVDNVQMREIFENLLNISTEIKKSFNFN